MFISTRFCSNFVVEVGLGVVAHACHSSTLEAKAEGLP